jgi:hypothetical protein
MIWLVVMLDVIFAMMAGSSLSHAIEEHRWGWAVFDAALLALWLYWFVRDTEKLFD